MHVSKCWSCCTCCLVKAGPLLHVFIAILAYTHTHNTCPLPAEYLRTHVGAVPGDVLNFAYESQGLASITHWPHGTVPARAFIKHLASGLGDPSPPVKEVPLPPASTHGPPAGHATGTQPSGGAGTGLAASGLGPAAKHLTGGGAAPSSAARVGSGSDASHSAGADRRFKRKRVALGSVQQPIGSAVHSGAVSTVQKPAKAPRLQRQHEQQAVSPQFAPSPGAAPPTNGPNLRSRALRAAPVRRPCNRRKPEHPFRSPEGSPDLQAYAAALREVDMGRMGA